MRMDCPEVSRLGSPTSDLQRASEGHLRTPNSGVGFAHTCQAGSASRAGAVTPAATAPRPRHTGSSASCSPRGGTSREPASECGPRGPLCVSHVARPFRWLTERWEFLTSSWGPLQGSDAITGERALDVDVLPQCTGLLLISHWSLHTERGALSSEVAMAKRWLRPPLPSPTFLSAGTKAPAPDISLSL